MKHLFVAVYVVIAVATAHHTAWGAAMTMEGPSPSEVGVGLLVWWLKGLAFAAAVDVAMFALAGLIRNRQAGRAAVGAFAFAAAISTYMQLLYAWTHMPALPASGGVPGDWQVRLQWLIDLRVLILPLALPVMSVWYTVAGLGGHGGGGGQAGEAGPVRHEHVHVHTGALPEAGGRDDGVVGDGRPRLEVRVGQRSGRSGGDKTGLTAGAVVVGDSGFVASCAVCGWRGVYGTERGARNAYTAHYKRHMAEVGR